MEYKSSNNTAAIFLIAALLESLDDQASNIWREFEQEITHCNRYFPSVESIRDMIEFFSPEAFYTLPKNTMIYRARPIKETELPENTRQLLKSLPDKNILGETRFSSYADKLRLLPLTKGSSSFIGELIDTELLQRFHKDAFWGFNSKDSEAPPIDKATAGRINPKGISYLYAAMDEHTAIVESRPIIGQMVSVAEIVAKKDLKLFDFCATPNDLTGKNGGNISMFIAIATRFAKPNHNDDISYCATQYVSEMLKEKFDGIRFMSSLHPDGKNIVLFNTEKDEAGDPQNYEVIKSSICFVNEIKVSVEKVLPQKQS